MRWTVFLVIFIIGLWLRFDCYQTKHPDVDELFELQFLQGKSITTVFDNKAFYGDHTSFPGEYLLYWIPLKVMGLFETPADLSYEDGTVDGIDNNGFWKLASVKIFLWVFGTFLFGMLCWEFGIGGLVAFSIWSFNFQLVYHAFEIRPYAVLPVLAVLNYWLCLKQSRRWDFVHALVILFTCIYHAYGAMIAFLPMFFMKDSRSIRIFYVIPFALAAWAFYASYSHFGFSPNKVQSVVDTFQYFPKTKFFETLLLNLSGGSLIFYALVPLLAFSFIRGLSSDDWLFLILLVVVPLLAIFLIDLKTHYWFHARQFVWVIPFFALWVGRMVDRLVKTP